jgi:hypothetical protein
VAPAQWVSFFSRPPPPCLCNGFKDVGLNPLLLRLKSVILPEKVGDAMTETRSYELIHEQVGLQQ